MRKWVPVISLAFWGIILAFQAMASPEGGEYTAMKGTASTSMDNITPQATTEQFSGAFTTTIPIEIPAGRHKIQPDLKLTYNSKNSNGVLGVGWSMPMASISRSMRKGVPQYNANDEFEYGGQELVLVGTNGNIKSYRLRQEGSFMRFEADTNDNSWIATDLNGTFYYFGKFDTMTARIGKDSTFNGTFQWNLVRVQDIYSNYMTVSYYTPENSINKGIMFPYQIRYTGFGGTQAFGSYPYNLIYPQSTEEDPFYVVEFEYEPNEDMTPIFSAGFEIKVRTRLNKIKIWAGNQLVRQYNLSYEKSHDSGRSLLTQIQLSLGDGASAMPPTKLTYSSIPNEQKGWTENDNWALPEGAPDFVSNPDNPLDLWRGDLGTRLIDINGDGAVDIVRAYRALVYYPSQLTTFTYYKVFLSDPVQGHWVESPEWEKALIDASYDLQTNHGSYSDMVFKEDEDNGCDNITQFNYCAKFYSSSFLTCNYNCHDDTYPTHFNMDGGLRIVDINGDGRPDLVMTKTRSNDVSPGAVYLNVSEGNTPEFSYSSGWQLPSSVKFVEQTKGRGDLGVRFADLNGDGLVDLIREHHDDDGTYYNKVYINTGDPSSGPWSESSAYESTWPTHWEFIDSSHSGHKHYGTGLEMADVNSDGLVDLLMSKQGSTPQTILNTGNGFQSLSESYANLAAPVSFVQSGATAADLGARLVDINRDGQIDLLEINTDNQYMYRLYSSGGGVWVESDSPSNGGFNISNLASFIEIKNGDDINLDLGVRLGDVNGDGAIDVVKGQRYVDSKAWTSNVATVPDLLVGIDNSQGASAKVVYDTYSAAKDSSACGDESVVGELPQSITVVRELYSSIVNPDGTLTYSSANKTLTTKQAYQYCGGYLFAGKDENGRIKREFRGFGEVTSSLYNLDDTNSAPYLKQTTYFMQDRATSLAYSETAYYGYHVGLPERFESYERVSDNSYNFRPVTTTQNGYTVASVLGSSHPEIKHTYQLYQGSTVYDYDGGTSPVHTSVETANEYDTTYGLIAVTKRTQNGLDTSGDERFYYTRYAYNPSKWIQKIDRMWMTTLPNWVYDQRISEKIFQYDNQPACTYGSACSLGGLGLLTGIKELLSDTDPTTSMASPATCTGLASGSTVRTTWSTTTGHYDNHGNLVQWNDHGVEKSIQYDDTTKSLPAVTITDPSGLGYRVSTTYDYRWGKVLTQKGPFTIYKPDAISSLNQYDGFGRLVDTYVKSYQGTRWKKTAEYEYRLNTCDDQGMCPYTPNVINAHMYREESGPMDSFSFYDGAGRLLQTKSEDTEQDYKQYQVVQDTHYNWLGHTASESLPYRIKIDSWDAEFWAAPYAGQKYYSAATRLFKAYTYDSRGRLTRVDFPDGTHNSAEFKGLIKIATDIVGNRARSELDAYGRILKITNLSLQGSDSTSIEYTYDGLDNLVRTDSHATPASSVINICYDSLSRKTWMSDPDMGEWKYQYDNLGNLKCQIDVLGEGGENPSDKSVCFDYDAINRVVRKYDLANNLNMPDHTHADCLPTLAGPTQNDIDSYYSTVHYAYDGYPAVVNHRPSTNYNTTGKLTAVYNLDNKTTPILQYIYQFDDMGRIATETFGIKDLKWDTSFLYNFSGQITRVTYPDDSHIDYEYDNIGLPTKVKNDTTVFATFGNVTSGNRVVTSGFTAMGQLAQIIYGNGVKDTFTYYDENEAVQKNYRLKSITTVNASDQEYFKNEFSYVLPGTNTITSNITSITDPRFGNQALQYDYLNRLTQATQSTPTPPSGQEFHITGLSSWGGYGVKNFNYAENGNITSMTRQDQLTPTTGAELMNYTYDAQQHHAVKQVRDTSNSLLYDATYNDNGSMTRKISYFTDSSRDQSYLYDSEGRMTATINNADSTRISDIFYHLQGGRLFEGQVATGSAIGSIMINPYYELKISSGYPVYMVKHIIAGGHRVGSVYQSFSDYSHAGLGCSTVSDRFMVASPREVIIGILVVFVFPIVLVILVYTRCFTTQHYRKHWLRNSVMLGSLVVLLMELSPYPLIEIADFNTLDDAQLTQALGKVLTATHQGHKIPVSSIDKQLFENEKFEKARGKMNFAISFGPRKAQASTLTSDILYFHTDQLGSVRLITRSDGSVYQYLNYLPFGKILEGAITGDDLPYFAQFKNSYTGQEMDRSTGLYFYQSRFYDAEIGRFISADNLIPSPSDAQAFSRYTYVNSNPFRYRDPTGAEPYDYSGTIGSTIALMEGAYYEALYEGVEALSNQLSMMYTSVSQTASGGVGADSMNGLKQAMQYSGSYESQNPNEWTDRSRYVLTTRDLTPEEIAYANQFRENIATAESNFNNYRYMNPIFEHGYLDRTGDISDKFPWGKQIAIYVETAANWTQPAVIWSFGNPILAASLLAMPIYPSWEKAKNITVPEKYAWCYDLNLAMVDYFKAQTTLTTNLPPGWSADPQIKEIHDHAIVEISLYHEGYLVSQYYADAYRFAWGYVPWFEPSMKLNQ